MKAFFEDIYLPLDTPILWPGNRAAVRLTSSPGEWRAKALANRALGARSLVASAALLVRFKATLGAQADVLAKVVGGKILPRQRELVGRAPLDYAV